LSHHEENAVQYTLPLATFAAELTLQNVPPSVVAHAKLCLLDTIGCGLFGSTLPWAQKVADLVSELEKGTALLWGSDRYAAAPGAALANGTATHGFELDDLHKESILHPGSVVVSAALAVADSLPNVTGAQFLAAMIAGYEVGSRAGATMGGAHLIQGWHPTGTHGTLAAAAACANLLGLSPEQTVHALGTAGSQSSGLMASQFSSMVKRLHAGRAAQSGVYSALLAARGFTGITNLFESQYGGYLSTFSPRYHADRMLVGLGEVWETAKIGFKPYSTNGSCQPAIDAILHLRQAYDIAAADVAAITIRCSTATKEHVGWRYQPDSITTAQMNLPYIAAVTLTDGEAFVDQFTEERIQDPALVELASRVQVTADPAIDAKGEGHRHHLIMAVQLHDGRVLNETRTHAKGSSAQPLTQEEIYTKFRRLAAKAIAPAQVAQLERAIEQVDQLSDMRTLSNLLRPQ
jgi:aconitate decarboxylase